MEGKCQKNEILHVTETESLQFEQLHVGVDTFGHFSCEGISEIVQYDGKMYGNGVRKLRQGPHFAVANFIQPVFQAPFSLGTAKTGTRCT